MQRTAADSAPGSEGGRLWPESLLQACGPHSDGWVWPCVVAQLDFGQAVPAQVKHCIRAGTGSAHVGKGKSEQQAPVTCLLCQRLEHALQHLRQVSPAWPVSPRVCNLVCSIPSPISRVLCQGLHHALQDLSVPGQLALHMPVCDLLASL